MRIDKVVALRKGEQVGEAEVSFPENYEEAEQLLGGTDNVIAAICRQIRLNKQASMRRPEGGKVAYQTYLRCIQNGISDEVARKASQYAGPSDGPN